LETCRTKKSIGYVSKFIKIAIKYFCCSRSFCLEIL